MCNHLQNGGGWRWDISYSEAIDIIALLKEKKQKSNSFEQISCIARNVVSLDRNFASVNSLYIYIFPMTLVDEI